jgi:hypothetical protein
VTTLNARRAYVNAVAANYVRLPGTPLRASRRDRRLAAALHDQGIPLRVVWTAFVIAATRRAVRGPTQRTLEPIRTLYYFLPAIEEVLACPPEPDYVHYLAAKLKTHVAEKEALLVTSRRGRESAVSDGR